jgi:aspartyl-tRNA(Asn)/glutamyl-tRNA(Gln) amidotransferase subunit A
LNRYDLTIHEAHQLLKNRELSSLELTRAVLERIDRVEKKVHAFVTVNEEGALQQATQADERIRGGEQTPLTGVPVLIKDNICTKTVTTTCHGG